MNEAPTTPVSAHRGPKLLAFAFAASMVATLVLRVLMPYLEKLFANNYLEETQLFTRAVFAVIIVLLIVGLTSMRSVVAPRAQSLITAALVFAGLELLAEVLPRSVLLSLMSSMPAFGQGVFVVFFLFTIGTDLFTWLALDRGFEKAGDTNLSLVLFTALAAQGLFFVGRSYLVATRDFKLLISLSFAELAIGLAVNGLLCVRALAASRASVVAAPADGLQSPIVAPPAESNDLLYGSIFLVGGLVVTIGSYSVASSGSGGGHYFVTTGAIAFGLVRIIRGLARR